VREEGRERRENTPSKGTKGKENSAHKECQQHEKKQIEKNVPENNLRLKFV
jgi:hypothetical protein